MDYRNLSNRKTIRLQSYDYSSPGYYFVTICTREKEHLFGEIRNGKMYPNASGDMATDEWYRTESIRDNVQLDAFVVMPNHMHGIIHITECLNDGYHVGAYRNTPLQIPQQRNTPLPLRDGKPLQSPSNDLGAIIRGV